MQRGVDSFVYKFFYRIFMCEIKVFILFSSLCLFLLRAKQLFCLSRIVQLVSFFTSIVVVPGDDLDSLPVYFISLFLIALHLLRPATCALFVRAQFCGSCLLFSYSQSLLSCNERAYWIDPIERRLLVCLYIFHRSTSLSSFSLSQTANLWWFLFNSRWINSAKSAGSQQLDFISVLSHARDAR